MYFNNDCEKPRCSRTAEKTYRGSDGNTLHLCEKCYYRLVTTDGGISGSVPDNNTNTSTTFTTKQT